MQVKVICLKYILLCLFLCLAKTSFGQPPSNPKLLNDLILAKKYYDDGNWEQSIETITHWLREKKVSREERWQIRYLLSLNYFFLDRQVEADGCIRNMINLNPGFKPQSGIEPSDYILFYNSFNFIPIGLGLRSAYTIGFVNVLGDHPLNGDPPDFDSNPEYQVTSNSQYGLVLELPIYKGLWFSPEIVYNSVALGYDDRSFSGHKLSYHEKMNYVEVPLSFKYSFLPGIISPYFRLGVTTGYMVNAKMRLSLDENKEGVFESTEKRYRWEINPMAGVGINIRVGQGVFSIEARYRQAVKNKVKPEMRFSDPDQIYNFFHLDDDFMVSTGELSLGYTFYFYKIYNPKKRLPGKI